jgi:hypothetical protein
MERRGKKCSCPLLRSCGSSRKFPVREGNNGGYIQSAPSSCFEAGHMSWCIPSPQTRTIFGKIGFQRCPTPLLGTQTKSPMLWIAQKGNWFSPELGSTSINVILCLLTKGYQQITTSFTAKAHTVTMSYKDGDANHACVMEELTGLSRELSPTRQRSCNTEATVIPTCFPITAEL